MCDYQVQHVLRTGIYFTFAFFPALEHSSLHMCITTEYNLFVCTRIQVYVYKYTYLVQIDDNGFVGK